MVAIYVNTLAPVLLNGTAKKNIKVCHCCSNLPVRVLPVVIELMSTVLWFHRHNNDVDNYLLAPTFGGKYKVYD